MDYRRCLFTLEQKDLLSINETILIASWLDAQSKLRKVSNPNNVMPTLSDIVRKISLFALAGECLHRLEKYDDCVALLDPFIELEVKFRDDTSGILLDLRESSEATNPLSSIYYLVGRSLDLLENRLDCIRLLNAAVLLDPSCIQAVDYLVKKRLISSTEKLDLYQQLSVTRCLKHLDSLYR